VEGEAKSVSGVKADGLERGTEEMKKEVEKERR